MTSSRSSSASSTFETTLEIELPGQFFDEIKHSVLSYQRRPSTNTHAIEKMSYYSAPPRRSTYDGSRSTSSVSRGGPVQPPSLPRAYTASAVSGFSGYVPSNVTGYRKRLDVEGLPQKDYLTSGASKRDRRPEYIGRAQSDSRRTSNGYQAGGGSSAAGNELVRYRSNQNFDDNATVVPEDSISQVSSNRSRPSQASIYSMRSGRSSHYERRASDAQSYLRSFYADNLSTYEGSQVYDEARGCWIVERKPSRVH